VKVALGVEADVEAGVELYGQVERALALYRPAGEVIATTVGISIGCDR